MEVLDLYDENRVFTGKTAERGKYYEEGLRVLVTAVFTMNGKGQLLMTLRSPDKDVCPNTWENNGGAARHLEDSLSCVQRELFEETGIRAEKEEFIFLKSYTGISTFVDVYLLKKDVPLEEIRLQPHETVDARWATREEYEAVIASGKMAPPVAARYEDLKEILWSGER